MVTIYAKRQQYIKAMYKMFKSLVNLNAQIVQGAG